METTAQDKHGFNPEAMLSSVASLEATNRMLQQVFDMIPDTYRERYNIRLMTAGEGWNFPVKYLDIEHGQLSILNEERPVSVTEHQDQLCLKVGHSAEIRMYKNFTCIYTLLL